MWRGVQLSSIEIQELRTQENSVGDGHTIGRVNMTGNSSGLVWRIGNINGQDRPEKAVKYCFGAANGVIVSTSNTETGGICGNLSVGEIYGCSFYRNGTKGYTAGGICSKCRTKHYNFPVLFAGDVQGEIMRQESAVIVHLKLLIIALVQAAVACDKDCGRNSEPVEITVQRIAISITIYVKQMEINAIWGALRPCN